MDYVFSCARTPVEVESVDGSGPSVSIDLLEKMLLVEVVDGNVVKKVAEQKAEEALEVEFLTKHEDDM